MDEDRLASLAVAGGIQDPVDDHVESAGGVGAPAPPVRGRRSRRRARPRTARGSSCLARPQRWHVRAVGWPDGVARLRIEDVNAINVNSERELVANGDRDAWIDACDTLAGRRGRDVRDRKSVV